MLTEDAFLARNLGYVVPNRNPVRSPWGKTAVYAGMIGGACLATYLSTQWPFSTSIHKDVLMKAIVTGFGVMVGTFFGALAAMKVGWLDK